MKRIEVQDDMFQSKRPKLDRNPSRFCYTEDSARLQSEWGDDELDCALEEVCIIAELSQRPTNHANDISSSSENTDNNFLTENNRLKEKLKTKEGEVAILRSQLQQHQATKHAESTSYRKRLDDMEEKYKTNSIGAARQVEKLQGELEFKDIELKGLREKLKQIEMKGGSCVSFVQPNNLFSLSQSINSKPRLRETRIENEKNVDEDEKCIEVPKTTQNEGQSLARLLDPSFFRECKERSIMSMYPTESYQRDEFDHTRDDKYKWIGLPENKILLSKMYPCIVELMHSEVFLKSTLEHVVGHVINVLQNLEQILRFLKSLPKDTKNERVIMENSCPGVLWNVDKLIEDKCGDIERGVEARRAVAVMSLICEASPTSVPSLATATFLDELVKVNEMIGQCLRPFEYSSVCVATLYFLQSVLAHTPKGNLDECVMKLIQRILGEIIMSRSKLDVMREIFRTFSAGAHHTMLLPSMCTRSSSRACALYMDARLQQAIFFTRKVCPLKLLQIQVKTLSFLTSSKEHFLATLSVYTSWLRALVASSRKPQVWLFADNDNCCDLLEGMMYLLYLCISHVKEDECYRMAFEKGVTVVRNCCKGQKRKFKFSTVKLFAGALKYSGILDALSTKARINAVFIINECDKDPSIQNSSLPLNSSLAATSVSLGVA